MVGPGGGDRSENVVNTIVPHQTTFNSEAKHLYQEGVLKNQGNDVYLMYLC